MAQIRKTTYLCDACGAEVGSKKELQSIQFVPKKGAGYDYSRSVKTELCDSCEAKLVGVLIDYVKDEDQATVKSYRRKAEA